MTIGTNEANIARVYDYVLGGKDNLAADRAVGDAIMAKAPHVRMLAWENRRFLIRSVRHLVGRRRVHQFLDIGCGLPTQENVHEVAQALAPQAKVVYVDNDPVVIAHGRALLSTDPGTAMVRADLGDPELILRRAAETLDFDRPIALMMIAILHFFPDDTGVHAIVRRLVDALPSGSYLVISHVEHQPRLENIVRRDYAVPGTRPVFRDGEQLTAFLAGTTVVEKVRSINQILPDAPGGPGPFPHHDDDPLAPIPLLGGIGRKP
ncbi:SAM-dependent methyltransferase [Spongiactinospora rosea]|uniref:SAM-dependent methyltransferase n=1 Tax=Spongiactinospora rosea TaxID=2248750 RepID=A0A366M489_9ACTN|nr:SAM-dependent methyltransferase [Spongiactinospora rosea]RBQ20857.1 SAM-dependent methyltransferase [Spongiactinospora rosea]